MSEVQLTILIISITSIGIIILGLLIIFTDILYDEDTGRFKSGINLPGLEGKLGDTINHKGYKIYSGINMILMALILLIVTIIFMDDLDTITTPTQEKEIALSYTKYLFIGLSIPLILMFSGIKEVFITRSVSKKPIYHYILLILVIGLLALIYFLMAAFM